MRLLLRLIIYGLIAFTIALGTPSFHYVTAIMIALIIRHKDNPNALFEPVTSHTFALPKRL